MSYNTNPFKPFEPYKGQIRTELALANDNFSIIQKAFIQNDIENQPVKGGVYVGNNPPIDADIGTLWLNTSGSKPQLNLFDGDNWLCLRMVCPDNTNGNNNDNNLTPYLICVNFNYPYSGTLNLFKDNTDLLTNPADFYGDKINYFTTYGFNFEAYNRVIYQQEEYVDFSTPPYPLFYSSKCEPIDMAILSLDCYYGNGNPNTPMSAFLEGRLLSLENTEITAMLRRVSSVAYVFVNGSLVFQQSGYFNNYDNPIMFTVSLKAGVNLIQVVVNNSLRSLYAPTGDCYNGDCYNLSVDIIFLGDTRKVGGLDINNRTKLKYDMYKLNGRYFYTYYLEPTYTNLKSFYKAYFNLP